MFIRHWWREWKERVFMNVWHALRLDECPRPCVVAFAGTTGKIPLMYSLAQTALARGHNVLATTTTPVLLHRLRPYFLPSPHPFPVEGSPFDTPKSFPHFVVRDIRPSPYPYVTGIPVSWLEDWIRRSSHDIYLVKAEGSMGPGRRELRLPSPVHVLVILAEWHDRPASVLAGKKGRGALPVLLARMVRRYALPTSVPWRVLFLHGVKDAQVLERVRGMLPLFLEQEKDWVQEVVLAPTPTGEVIEVWGRVAAVILAAGAGTRFGGPKQVALWRGRPLIWHVLDAVVSSPVDEIVVVTGAHRAVVEESVHRWQRQQSSRNPVVPLIRLVHAANWAEGQSRSVQAGVQALGKVHGALFPLADQPRLSSSLLEALITKHRHTLAGMIVPTYHGQPGAPVLFDRRFFRALEGLEGDKGGRALRDMYPEAALYLPWEDASAGWDVDRPEDLETGGGRDVPK